MEPGGIKAELASRAAKVKWWDKERCFYCSRARLALGFDSTENSAVPFHCTSRFSGRIKAGLASRAANV